MRKLPSRKLPSRKLLGAVIAAALLIPNAGFTLGLGEIEVNSALNQKLNADIELLSAAPEDSETIIIKLASRKQFTRAGLDRPYLLNDLRFKSVIVDGVPHIKVTSSSPIREPFLNFLIEIDWPNGHLLREYTILLDPPVFMTQPASAAPAAAQGGASSNAGFRPTSEGSTNVVPVVTPGMSASARPASSASIAPTGQNQAPAQVVPQPQSTWIPAPVLQQQTSINQPTGSYKIKAGDTAWSLADAMRPDQSITVPQMMVAMLRANPESFINENINGLKRGYILRVPDYDQIASISQQEALALVREQSALWRQYQQAQSGSQPVSAMEADGMADDGMATEGGSATAQDDAYLEIVSAGSGSSTMSGKDPTQMSAKELRAELALAREKVETGLVEKEALQQRVDTLQKHVDKMKGMLSIEDTELAEMQSPTQMPGMSTEEPAEEMPVDEVVSDTEEVVVEEGSDSAAAEEDIYAGMTDEEVLAEAMKDEVIAEEGEAEDGTEAAVFVDETGGEADTEMPVQEAPEAPVTPVQPQLVDNGPTDLLSKLLNNPMMLAAAGGGLLLITALIALIFKRRKASAEAETSEVVNGFDDLESLADDIAEETAGDVQAEAGSDEATDEFDSDSTMILDSVDDTVITEPDESAVEDDEARDDVIAEADVYLAYGIYQQAEELLAQAIEDNPDREDYRVKLAETHYASKDPDAFVKTATDLKSRVEENSSAWKKVAAMGQDLCADNPMFQGSMIGEVVSGIGVLSSETPEMDFDLGGDDDEDSNTLADLGLDNESLDELPEELPEIDDTVAAGTGDLEFDLSETEAEEESDNDEDEFSLDIDASELDIDIEEEVVESASEEIDLSDLDIGLDDEVAEGGDTEIDLDFGLDEIEDSAEAAAGDEVEEEVVLDLTEEAEALDIGVSDDTVVAEEISEPESEPEIELGDVDDEDEDDFDLSSLDDVDEISTKLDLARAYLDMGDHEGTRGILEEVLAEGSDEQKQEASELMSKLG
ncbi:MAG TPA: hypothetical protein ENJ87_03945 [Gammaproteobacteria bacterium]|nr:hypothetical protein [Gammaproteobacteria bacterium]